ncbi:MAG: hypothetical protein ACI4SG_05935 [Oligosphaeraceae bacterium]
MLGFILGNSDLSGAIYDILFFSKSRKGRKRGGEFPESDRGGRKNFRGKYEDFSLYFIYCWSYY